MIHKLQPDYDTGLQGSELDTMRGIKKGQEEEVKENFLEEVTFKPRPR